MSLTFRSLLLALTVLALTGCEFGGGDLATTPAVTDPAPAAASDAPDVDLLDDDAVGAVHGDIEALFAPTSTPDVMPGLEAAEEWLLGEIALQMSADSSESMPDDLVGDWLARPELGDSVADEARTEDSDAPVCPAVAVIAGIWLDSDDEYLGLWWAPSADVLGPMAGVTRGLATPGGQWGGGFGTWSDRLGPQGGLYFRDYDGTGSFVGMWSAPASPYEGAMGGHWVRVGAWGGYYFGVMTVCPW